MNKLIIAISLLSMVVLSGCTEKPPYCKYGYDNNEDKCITLDKVNYQQRRGNELIEKMTRTSGCETGCWVYDELAQNNLSVTIEQHNYLVMECTKRCYEE